MKYLRSLLLVLLTFHCATVAVKADVPNDESSRYTVLTERLFDAAKREDYQGAQEIIESNLKSFSDESIIFRLKLSLVNVFAAQEKWDIALEQAVALKREAVSGSDKFEASIALGDVYRQMKNTDKAVDEYKGVLDIPKLSSNGKWDSYFHQYLAYRAWGKDSNSWGKDSNFAAMRNVLQSGIETPNLDKGQVVFAELLVAKSYYDEGKYDESGRYLEDVFTPYADALDIETRQRAQQDIVDSVVLRGKVYYQQQNYYMAQTTMEQVLDRNDVPKDLRQEAQSYLEKSQKALTDGADKTAEAKPEATP